MTNVELFFDLVYVFAVTQLSHLLVEHTTTEGASCRPRCCSRWCGRSGSTRPGRSTTSTRTRYAARGDALLLMLGSLVLGRGDARGVPRPRIRSWRAPTRPCRSAACLFTIWALRGEQLQMVFVRILPWSHGEQRGGARRRRAARPAGGDGVGERHRDRPRRGRVGFYVPGLGPLGDDRLDDQRQPLRRTVPGVRAHRARRVDHRHRCAARRARALDPRRPRRSPLAFAGAVALWWVYFDRAAEDSAREIADLRRPGTPGPQRLPLRPPADRRRHHRHRSRRRAGARASSGPADTATAWLVLGGIALFLAGHAVFKALVWRTVSWPRVIGGRSCCSRWSRSRTHVSARWRSASARWRCWSPSRSVTASCTRLDGRDPANDDQPERTSAAPRAAACRTSTEDGGPSDGGQLTGHAVHVRADRRGQRRSEPGRQQ